MTKIWYSKNMPKSTIQNGTKRVKRQVVIIGEEKGYLVGQARLNGLHLFYKKYDGYQSSGFWMPYKELR
jgi:hypothetical protein